MRGLLKFQGTPNASSLMKIERDKKAVMVAAFALTFYLPDFVDVKALAELKKLIQDRDDLNILEWFGYYLKAFMVQVPPRRMGQFLKGFYCAIDLMALGR